MIYNLHSLNQTENTDSAGAMCTALFYLLSHELRNPLASIISSSDFYLNHQSTLSGSKKSELVTYMNHDSHQLFSIMENVLSICKLSASPLSFTDEALDAIITAALHRIRMKAPAISISISAPTDILLISMDTVLLQHAFMLVFDMIYSQVSPDTPLTCEITVADSNAQIQVFANCTSNKLGSVQEESIQTEFQICNLIIKAHQGALSSISNPMFFAYTITLPLKENSYDV